MKSKDPTELPAEVEAEIIPARRRGFSWAWLFPILALIATTWLYWDNWKSRGPEITIYFDTAPGIEPSKTVLSYLGVKAGVVESVALDEKLEKVVVTVRLKAFAANLARENTDFWIDQPVISLRDISGLQSIIQGNSIQARARGGTNAEYHFQGLREAPLAPLVTQTLLVKLRSRAISFIGRGTPVFYRGIKVGLVRAKVFDESGQPEVEIIVAAKFASKVRSNSRFWFLPATAVSVRPGAVSLNIPSIEGVLDGGIAFDQFGPDGNEVTSGATFDLSPDEIAARADGPLMGIEFDDCAGLRAGESQVTYLGKPVGLLETLTANPQTRRVEACVRLESAYAPLATEDSSFTIIRPNFSKKGLQGLDTIVTGSRIEFEPGKSKVPATQFVGHEVHQFDWNPFEEEAGSTRVVLWAGSLPQLTAGAPVYYHGMIAGRVIESRIGQNGRPEMVVSIGAKFREFLRVNSRFWRVPAALVTVGPGVVGVEMQGLSAIWQGGIAFDAIGSPGPVAAETAEYEVHVSELAASAISEPIRIFFADGQGLLAGKTELKYLGIPIGIVERVESISGKIEATARFQPGYEFLTRKGSEFAIVKPEVDLQGVKGIETLVGGIYIACSPGTGSEYAASFDAVPAGKFALMNDSGIEIVLESPSTSVSAGAPISYNHTDVGTVVSKTLSQDGKRILLTARIREEYSSLLRSNSVFWADNTIEGKVWIFKVKFDRPALVAPNGRIAFYTPDKGGGPAAKGKVFSLLSKQPGNTLP
ncbi:MAG TPA: MlaD family protein [Verrucomicrobiae bacterium]|nr:MlaD family protein [Verrucomicrobiae bacterium]